VENLGHDEQFHDQNSTLYLPNASQPVPYRAQQQDKELHIILEKQMGQAPQNIPLCTIFKTFRFYRQVGI
jgi:hypothetical protein